MIRLGRASSDCLRGGVATVGCLMPGAGGGRAGLWNRYVDEVIGRDCAAGHDAAAMPAEPWPTCPLTASSI